MNTGTQRDQGYNESYAFNANGAFAIGGTADDWEKFAYGDED